MRVDAVLRYVLNLSNRAPDPPHSPFAVLQEFWFDQWACTVEDLVTARNEDAAARTIERVTRGWLGRRRWMSRFWRYSRAVLELQRICRGHVGRVRVQFMRRRRRDAARREKREARVRRMRGGRNERAARENLRRAVEQEAVEDASRAADVAAYGIRLRRQQRRKLESARRAECRALEKHILAFGQRNALLLESLARGLDTSYMKVKLDPGESAPPVPVKYLAETNEFPLKKKTVRRIAERWLRSVSRSRAALSALHAFRASRPPPHECPLCLHTYMDQDDEHVCPPEASLFLWSPQAFYEFGFAEAGAAASSSGAKVGTVSGGRGGARARRQRRMSSIIT